MVADTSYLPSPTPVPPDDEGSSVIYLQEAMRKCDVAMCVVAASPSSGCFKYGLVLRGVVAPSAS